MCSGRRAEKFYSSKGVLILLKTCFMFGGNELYMKYGANGFLLFERRPAEESTRGKENKIKSSSTRVQSSPRPGLNLE